MTQFLRFLQAFCFLLASGLMHASAAEGPVQETLSISPDGKTRVVAKFIPDHDEPEYLELEGLYVEVERKLTRIQGSVSLMVGMSQNRFDWDVHWAPDGSSVAIYACHKHLSRVDVLLREGNRYRLLDELVKFDLKKEVLAWMKIHRLGNLCRKTSWARLGFILESIPREACGLSSPSIPEMTIQADRLDTTEISKSDLERRRQWERCRR